MTTTTATTEALGALEPICEAFPAMSWVVARNRRDEVKEFMEAVFTTACEGGIQYWAGVFEYDCDDCTAVLVEVEDASGLEALYATQHRRDADIAAKLDQLPPEVVHRVNLATVVKGFAKLAQQVEHMSAGYRGTLISALERLEAGDLDADDCDTVLQLGALGEVRYS